MSRRLPEHIDPLKLAEKQRSLEGEIPLARMSRLAQALYGTEGVANVMLSFHRDSAGWPVIEGCVKAELVMQCQRCMGSMQLPVKANVHLGIVSESQLSKLPEDLEPLVCDDDLIALSALVEDELILALPVVALHEQSQCPVEMAVVDEQATLNTSNGESKSERENPFLILADLKTKLKHGKE